MDFLTNIFNPKPEFENQCIVGQSGIPLIAARIHPKNGRTHLAWRAADVVCGFAMDGGLQQLMRVLDARSPTEEKVVHVAPEIYRNKDIMGAIQAVLGGDYDIVNSDWEPPREGNIVVKLPQPNDRIVEVFKAAPTLTATGSSLGATPIAESVPVVPAASPAVAAAVAAATPESAPASVASPVQPNAPPPTPAPVPEADVDLFWEAMGGARKSRRRRSRKSRKSRRSRRH